jgi:putative ATP-dependent endonuclease of OLD family
MGRKKTTKNLKKYYEEVFGKTDITKCPNITILDNTDFEGYLISSGFKPTIEAVIKELDGADAINNWIEKNHGTSTGRERTSAPPCSSCKQHIYADVLRNYKSANGYDQALIDILYTSKPKYAPTIAEKLCELEIEKFPPKVIELFDKIKVGAVL